MCLKEAPLKISLTWSEHQKQTENVKIEIMQIWVGVGTRSVEGVCPSFNKNDIVLVHLTINVIIYKCYI